MSNKEIKAEDFVLVEKDEEEMLNSVVERQNITTEFKVGDIVDHQKDLLKMQAELSSQATVCKATIDNIERNHEFIKELDNEQRHHVWMCYENQDVLEKSNQKLEQVEEQLKQYEDLMEVLHEKFGFVPTDVTNTEDEQDEPSK